MCPRGAVASPGPAQAAVPGPLGASLSLLCLLMAFVLPGFSLDLAPGDLASEARTVPRHGQFLLLTADTLPAAGPAPRPAGTPSPSKPPSRSALVPSPTGRWQLPRTASPSRAPLQALLFPV